jgi:hypothetical protein
MAEELKRVVPPAFPTDVGAWVEDIASEALGQRESLLAEIESSSGMAPVPSSDSALRVKAGPSKPPPTLSQLNRRRRLQLTHHRLRHRRAPDLR